MGGHERTFVRHVDAYDEHAMTVRKIWTKMIHANSKVEVLMKYETFLAMTM